MDLIRLFNVLTMSSPGNPFWLAVVAKSSMMGWTAATGSIGLSGAFLFGVLAYPAFLMGNYVVFYTTDIGGVRIMIYGQNRDVAGLDFGIGGRVTGDFVGLQWMLWGQERNRGFGSRGSTY